ncbi:MAG: flagellar motor switch protein FliG, partial [Oscillibacter sp.]|nr:flagellar motor switch protein FliG [Oscillibacter sp.]
MEAPSPTDIIRNMTGMQKAAAVIIALGADKASLIYQHMDPEDVEQVTLEVARIGFLSMDVSEAVLTEFY